MANNKIAYYRRRMGLSQRELAEHIVVSAGYVSMLETGKATPTDEMIERIASFFNVKPADILASTSPTVELIETLIKLTETGQMKWKSEDALLTRFREREYHKINGANLISENYISISTLEATYFFVVRDCGPNQLLIFQSSTYVLIADSQSYSNELALLLTMIRESAEENSLTAQLLEDAKNLLGDN